jgi:hypothetical protein
LDVSLRLIGGDLFEKRREVREVDACLEVGSEVERIVSVPDD